MRFMGGLNLNWRLWEASAVEGSRAGPLRLVAWIRWDGTVHEYAVGRMDHWDK